MSRTKALENVKLTSFDDLFGGNKMEKTAEAGDVKEIPLSELHEFHNHPFQIRSDEELTEMIESVREHMVCWCRELSGNTKKAVMRSLPDIQESMYARYLDLRQCRYL